MSLPHRLIIEPTSRCNLHCVICLREVCEEPTGDMTMETYSRLLPLFPSLDLVNLTGYGEPLLNSRLLEMVRLAKKTLPPHGRVAFTTNGSLITPGVAREIVESGLDELGISIEGCSEDIHNRIRLGSDFNEVLEKAALVVEAKQRLGVRTPRLIVHFVAMKRNLRELPSLVGLAHRIGADGVVVSHLLAHTAETKDETIFSYHSAEALAYFHRAKAEAEAGKLSLSDILDFIPYIYTLAGLPPLRNILPLPGSWTERVPEGKRRVTELVAHTIAEAAAYKVALNFASLVKGEGMAYEEADEIFTLTRSEAERYGVDLTLPSLHPGAHRECGFVRNSTSFITWDGHIRPCQNLSHGYMCYLNGRQKHVTPVTFGNVNTQWPQEIWDSPGYKRFRNVAERFDFPPCGDCGFADGCSLIRAPFFEKDCYFQRQPCGDCPWSRGLLQC